MALSVENEIEKLARETLDMINDETGESLFYPKNSQSSTSEFIVQQQSVNTFVRPQEQMKSHV